MGLVFRGIWVGATVDEERAAFQRSFQSFSRKFLGVCRVLAFYADVTGSDTRALAEEHRHVLIYVVRVKWATDAALPVQAFDGPNAPGDGEFEVLLPPAVWYEFEDISLHSSEYGESAWATKLGELRSRWPGFVPPP